MPLGGGPSAYDETRHPTTEDTVLVSIALEHGKLPDPVAKAIRQLVDKLNRINIRIAEVEERGRRRGQDRHEVNGTRSTESLEASADDPASKTRH